MVLMEPIVPRHSSIASTAPWEYAIENVFQQPFTTLKPHCLGFADPMAQVSSMESTTRPLSLIRMGELALAVQEMPYSTVNTEKLVGSGIEICNEPHPL